MPPDPRAVESLLSFWAEAGVETSYADTPVDRLAAGAALPTGRAVRPPAIARPAADPSAGQLETIDHVAQARRLAAEATDLAGLGRAISDFDGCPLKTAGARQAVFARGLADAPVMVIGEAPGAEEDIRGEPFVGRAGQLLDRMLAAAGLGARVWITNTVFWRPPGNRTPTLAEQQLCAPFLERAIELVRPKILLLVGGASAKSVLGVSEGILSLRGRWFEWRSHDGRLELPAMPTLHPAFLLRQPAAKKKAWSDLQTLVERLNRTDRPA